LGATTAGSTESLEGWRQGPEALEALWRECLGELTADDLKCLAEFDSNVEQVRHARACPA
jgi:hypothetical protein